jgi:hypothetical protein
LSFAIVILLEVIKMSDNVNIEIQYLLKEHQEWNCFKLSPQEYFDLEESETIELDCVPQYAHALDYLREYYTTIDLTQILVTRIILIDFLNKKQRQINERFWFNSQNRLIERLDLDLTKFQIDYHEIIIETKIQDDPPRWEILRLNQQQQMMTPIFHSIIQQNSDGSEIETPILIEPFSLNQQATFPKQLV